MGLSISLLYTSWQGILKNRLSSVLCYDIGFSPEHGGVILNGLKFKTRDCESITDHATKKNLFHEPLASLSLPDSVAVMDVIPRSSNDLDKAAVKLQKVYKSYRTRRNLADCAIVVEELWWKALDFAALKRSSISFFSDRRHETAVSKWARAKTRVAKVGKGLSKDENAQKLALQHWLEAIDPRHRYGHNLHLYYDIWFESESNQPFFYWLDIGDGKEVNLEKCQRNLLHNQCIKYLGPKEREAYEVIVENGKLVYKQSGVLVDTRGNFKWIFVLSTTKVLYVGRKRKGKFQHSSFLSGGAIAAAGRLVAHDGVLESVWPYSGHYHPTEENFKEFILFLEENHVDLTDVKRYSTDEDSAFGSENDGQRRGSNTGSTYIEHADGLYATNSQMQAVFDLSKRLSCKWATGAGPRIGCVRDYPSDMQSQALEYVNLSPRINQRQIDCSIPSPRPSPRHKVSPRLSCMGLPSPRHSFSPSPHHSFSPNPTDIDAFKSI